MQHECRGRSATCHRLSAYEMLWRSESSICFCSGGYSRMGSHHLVRDWLVLNGVVFGVGVPHDSCSHSMTRPLHRCPTTRARS